VKPGPGTFSELRLEGVGRRFGDQDALSGLSLTIRSGEFIALLGPSGCGKSTALNCLAGLLPLTTGSIWQDDQRIDVLPPEKRGFGMVFQNYALFPHLTVGQNVAYPLTVRKVAKAEAEKRVTRALDMVRLKGMDSRLPSQLSGGQQQRVALARALVFEPQLVLMDEPLGALDKQLREHMQIELRQLHDKLGMTTVYVTHDQREALTMSDRIAVINGGRIMQLAAPRAIYERPANRFVAEFIGESTFVPVVVDGGAVAFGSRQLRPATAEADGPRLLMLRPERLQVLAPGHADGLNLLDGRLIAAVYQGDSSLLQVALADGTTVGVRCASFGDSATDELALGAHLTLGLAPRDTVLLPAEAIA